MLVLHRSQLLTCRMPAINSVNHCSLLSLQKIHSFLLYFARSFPIFLLLAVNVLSLCFEAQMRLLMVVVMVRITSVIISV